MRAYRLDIRCWWRVDDELLGSLTIHSRRTACKADVRLIKLAPAAELYRNNLFGGTAFSCYGSFWLAFGTFGMTSSGGILSAPTKFPHGMEMFLSLWGKADASYFTCSCLLENLCRPILRPDGCS